MGRRATATVLAVAIGAALAIAAVATFTAGPASAATSPSGLHVSGNKMLDGASNPVLLRGVDRAGTEYQCKYGSTFDGPHDDASIAAMASWHINAVRVPLNEDCWLGINGLPSGYTGAAYRSDIEGYVSQLHAAGLVAILDLHFTSSGGTNPSVDLNDMEQPMPDADHAPAFWTSVATTFKSDSSTVFDLYNEPHDVSWTCWRDGGDCGIGYQVAGMQSLLNAVRSTGATNSVLAGGLGYANDLSQWLQYKPSDPTGNLAASWHTYNFNGCNNVSCWDSQVAPVIASVPLVTGEVGENDCAHGYLDHVLPWLDDHKAGYLGWGWATHDCDTFPSLITDYDGTPTPFGTGLRDHLASLAAQPSPSPTTTTPTPTSPAPTTTSATTPVPTTTAPSGSGTIAVSATADTSKASYYWEEVLNLTPSARVSTLAVTVTVKHTPGVSYNDFYSTANQGDLTLGETTSAKTLVYKATLNSGRLLTAGQTVKIGVQFTGNGTSHAISGDTYAVRGTVGGKAFSSSGHF